MADSANTWVLFEYSNASTHEIKITLDMLDNFILDDINFDNPVRLIDYSDSQSINIVNKLMNKLHGVKKLIIGFKNYKLVITNVPSTVIELTDYGYNTTLGFSPDSNLQTYNINNYIRNVVIPVLPESVKTVSINVKSTTNSLLALPASVTSLTIKLEELECDLNIWPVMLEYLDISIQYTGVYSISMLPHNLTTLKLYMNKINNIIDMPPLLKNLIFISSQEYPFYLEDLPDGIEYFKTAYYTKPNIMHLPKNCKKFVYFQCKETHFRELCKKYKGKCKISNT